MTTGSLGPPATESAKEMPRLCLVNRFQKARAVPALLLGVQAFIGYSSYDFAGYALTSSYKLR
jgi:hypothetical protein